MGFPQRIDDFDEEFLRILDEIDDEWYAEQQAKRQQEAQQTDAEELRMTVEEESDTPACMRELVPASTRPPEYPSDLPGETRGCLTGQPWK